MAKAYSQEEIEALLRDLKAERKAREEAEKKEAEAEKKAEDETKAREEAEKKEAEAEKKEAEAEKKVEDETKAREEAEKKAEDETKAREEAEKKLSEVKTIYRNGLPPLSIGSLTPSQSGTENADFKNVNLLQAEIQVLKDPDIKDVVSSSIWSTYIRKKAISWSREADIVVHVKNVVKELLHMCELTSVDISSELSVHSLRPDMWVLRRMESNISVPIGVIEVKVPGVNSRVEVENGGISANVDKLNSQVGTYAGLLASFYGLDHVFVIATTYMQWCVYWLPGADIAASSTNLTRETNGEEYLDNEGAVKLRASRWVAWNDTSLVPILCSVLKRMENSPVNPGKEFDSEKPYLSVNESGLKWIPHLPKEGNKYKYDEFTYNSMIGTNIKDLLLLEDLGGATHGRVWKVCASANGVVGVLKFAGGVDTEDGKTVHDVETLSREMAVWHDVWCEHIGVPTSQIRMDTWDKCPGLLMPYCHPVAEEEKDDLSVIQLVHDALKRLRDKKYIHGDIHWRHVGLFKNDGKDVAILFDLGLAKKVENEEAEKSLVDALEKLGISER